MATTPAAVRAEWESWVRANMSTADVISYHSRLPGDAGWCFGCLEMWLRYVKAPCRHRLVAERKLAKEKADRIVTRGCVARRG